MASPCLVQRDLAGEAPEEPQELRAGIGDIGGVGGLAGIRHEGDDAVQHDGLEQRAPVREVPVDGADPDARGARDGVEGDGDAVLGEQVAGGGDHQFPVAARVRPQRLLGRFVDHPAPLLANRNRLSV
jgi:hypothetical protein